ncbi:pupal cuticle protein Edg-78E-like [Stomoxys calcitrans]|uniref:pupal cuticle protein Edg-78E-like n=1 Tax=Stomoxys calcitrans TaxID=35570 RepID=UPI0027E3196E|nr:pupal cuticle protein Edg-78E-like [Stomoxys calcitrans]
MRITILFVFIACVALSRARLRDRIAKTRRYINKAPDARGNYYYAFDTTNNIQVQAAGNPLGVTGSVGYVSPEGKVISLTYTADSEGYHPVGAHLPTPHPMPDYIRRSLEYIRSHPPKPSRIPKPRRKPIKKLASRRKSVSLRKRGKRNSTVSKRKWFKKSTRS